MKTRFSQDIIPLSELKINPGKIVNRAKDTHRPILLTSRGRGIAVMQGLEEYEKHEEERAFIKAIAQGLMEVKEGKVQSISEAKKKLGINI
jgi:prevent-host-death family protein